MLTVFTAEPKVYPLAIGPTCMERDHCEGSPFQLLWSPFVSSLLGEAGICFHAIWLTFTGRIHSEGSLP